MATNLTVRVLFLEDGPDDIALVQQTLARDHIDAQLQVVSTRDAYVAALERGGFDMILSNSGLAGFESTLALQIARRVSPQTPFIFFCGSFEGEHAAGRLSLLGATDCISKTQLEQLAVAVRAAIDPNQKPGTRASDLWYPRAMEYLVTVVQELSLARDLAGIMKLVRRAARELTAADGATFVLRDGDLCFYADEDAISPLWKGQRFPMSTCISGWVMLNRQPAVIENIFADSRIPADAYRPTFVKSLAMVPIRTASPIGAIGNYWASDHLATPQEVKALQALADCTSVAMENVQLYSELEHRVQDRTAQLQAANKELEAFSYSVSHDLRAPLRSIDGFSRALEEDYLGKIDEQGQDYLRRVRTAAQRMARLIDDLLNLSRTTRAPVQKQTVDLTQIAREQAAAWQATDPNRIAAIKIADGICAEGDAGLMRIVLENLFSNAWKFTAKRADTRIEFGMNRVSEGEVIFHVRDNGAGFDMNNAQRLFGAFQRLHTEAEFPGTGIGLATVQRIIHKHGGRVWAEGAVDQGATFYFTLG